MDRHGGHCVLQSEWDFTRFYYGDYMWDTDVDSWDDPMISGIRKRYITSLQDTLTPEERSIGMQVLYLEDAPGVRLSASSLEELLVRIFFEELVRQQPISRDIKLSKSIEQYCIHMFTRSGNKVRGSQQLRSNLWPLDNLG